MITYDVESISRVANSIYQKGVASVPARELSIVPAGPDHAITVPEKINQVKPAPTTESGLYRAGLLFSETCLGPKPGCNTASSWYSFI